jgi:hypothetical protein
MTHTSSTLSARRDKIMRVLTLLGIVGLLGGSALACNKNSEEPGASASEGAEDVGDKVEEGAEDTGDKIEEATE